MCIKRVCAVNIYLSGTVHKLDPCHDDVGVVKTGVDEEKSVS